MSSEREPGGERDPQRRSPSRYSLFVGVAFVVLIVIAAANTFGGGEDAILGAGEAERGEPLAEFAVPELLGETPGDANVFQDDCASSRNPCPADDVRTPACEVELERIIRVCDLFDRPLAISFWFTEGGDCLPTQDAFDEVARRFQGRVNFLSINVRDDRDEARGIVEERGWTVPVGYDADGAVADLYRIGVCPTVAFAYPGGLLSEARLGADALGADELTTDVERLLRESRARAEEMR